MELCNLHNKEISYVSTAGTKCPACEEVAEITSDKDAEISELEGQIQDLEGQIQDLQDQLEEAMESDD